MEYKSEVIGKFELPTYTTEESMVRTKLQLKIGLKDTDIKVLANDIVKNIKGDIDFSNQDVKRYLDSKYPGWFVSDKLIERIKQLKATSIE